MAVSLPWIGSFFRLRTRTPRSVQFMTATASLCPMTHADQWHGAFRHFAQTHLASVRSVKLAQLTPSVLSPSERAALETALDVPEDVAEWRLRRLPASLLQSMYDILQDIDLHKLQHNLQLLHDATPNKSVRMVQVRENTTSWRRRRPSYSRWK